MIKINSTHNTKYIPKTSLSNSNAKQHLKYDARPKSQLPRPSIQKQAIFNSNSNSKFLNLSPIKQKWMDRRRTQGGDALPSTRQLPTRNKTRKPTKQQQE